jgi:hypothetical protein
MISFSVISSSNCGGPGGDLSARVRFVPGSTTPEPLVAGLGLPNIDNIAIVAIVLLRLIEIVLLRLIEIVAIVAIVF